MPSPLTSVPGQVTAGYLDGFLRDDAGDGTLGTPDLSPVPYTYAPLLEPVGGDLRWVVDQITPGGFGAFKGSADGLGALRPVGGANGAFMVQVVPQATGTKLTPTSFSTRNPDWTWGPRDFALAVRHPGTTGWDASSVRAYVSFLQFPNTVGIRMTTPAAFGPWDTERTDTASLSLSAAGRPNLWDGAAHSISVAAFGSNVLCFFDFGVHCATFRAPRSYQRVNGVTVVPGVFSDLPTSGSYGGFDARGSENYLYSWTALQGASGDFFYYDEGPLSFQGANLTTYTPSVLPSGETWNLTGTVTASKNGILLAASSTAYFNVSAPHGLIATKWGGVTSGGGLMVRRIDANNYYLITNTGVYRYTGGVLANTLNTFTTPLVTDDYVTVRNLPNQMLVWVNGQQVCNVVPSQGSTATGFGFLSPAGGTSQFRFIGLQPLTNPPVMPTS